MKIPKIWFSFEVFIYFNIPKSKQNPTVVLNDSYDCWVSSTDTYGCQFKKKLYRRESTPNACMAFSGVEDIETTYKQLSNEPTGN